MDKSLIFLAERFSIALLHYIFHCWSWYFPSLLQIFLQRTKRCNLEIKMIYEIKFFFWGKIFTAKYPWKTSKWIYVLFFSYPKCSFRNFFEKWNFSLLDGNFLTNHNQSIWWCSYGMFGYRVFLMSWLLVQPNLPIPCDLLVFWSSFSSCNIQSIQSHLWRLWSKGL